MSEKRIFGAAGVVIAQEHIYTFLLSSPFTARTIVKEKNEQKKVKEDLLIALTLSLGMAVLFGLLAQDQFVLWFGAFFAAFLYFIYAKRAELI